MSLHIGQRIERWTIIAPAAPYQSLGGRLRRQWLCQCDCGQRKVVLAQSLALALRSDTGGSRSCGCLCIEQSLKHGANRHQKPTPEYQAWLSAKKRCYNVRNPSYSDYGGRGIKMCARWLNNFQNFIDDMGAKPTSEATLDRIDPDGDYEPGNCRWTSMATQARNRRGNTWYLFEGQLALIGDIAEFFGISRDCARRLYRKGLLPIKKVERPPGFSPDERSKLILDLNNSPPFRDGFFLMDELVADCEEKKAIEP